VQKLSKAGPAPNSYKLELSWKGKNADMKGPKRITVIDKIREEKKSIPAPNRYKNLDSQRKKIPNGKFDKTKDLCFLSEVQYLGKNQPGPTKYTNLKLSVLARFPAWKWPVPKKLESWKPKKSKGPDLGSYDQHVSIKKSSSMKKITFTLPFGGGKIGNLTSKEKKNANFKDKAYYLQQGVRDKKYIPGVGSYK
jgi:hypothetical protein